MNQNFRRLYHASTLNSSGWLRWLLNIKDFAELHLVQKATTFTKAGRKLIVFDSEIEPNKNESVHLVLVHKKLQKDKAITREGHQAIWIP